ncbi:MAG: ATP-binding protein, partial [Pseudomonadota bacterium]
GKHHLSVQTGEIMPGNYACISVSDTGEGIPPHVLEHVFEPFFTTKPRGKGTGMGLAMVYGFVQQSGGLIKIYSEVGHGTTVSLYLPFASDVHIPEKNTPLINSRLSKGKVLIVE